jgi:hypothetical protein
VGSFSKNLLLSTARDEIIGGDEIGEEGTREEE